MAKWFPVKERALASGIFNSGSSIGALIAHTVSRVPVTSVRVASGDRGVVVLRVQRNIPVAGAFAVANVNYHLRTVAKLLAVYPICRRFCSSAVWISSSAWSQSSNSEPDSLPR